MKKKMFNVLWIRNIGEKGSSVVHENVYNSSTEKNEEIHEPSRMFYNFATTRKSTIAYDDSMTILRLLLIIWAYLQLNHPFSF